MIRTPQLLFRATPNRGVHTFVSIGHKIQPYYYARSRTTLLTTH
jgi:hypothetical protein